MPAPNPPIYNLFAHELVTIITDHDPDLDKLRRDAAIDARKKPPLVDPIHHGTQLSSLSAVELTEVKYLYKINDPDETLRLNAALIALGIQKQLLDHHLPGPRAREIALEIQQHVLQWLRAQHQPGDDPTLRMTWQQSSAPLPSDVRLDAAALFAAVSTAYDEAEWLMTLAELSDDSDEQLDLKEEALPKLKRAARLLGRALPLQKPCVYLHLWLFRPCSRPVF